jgi:hypothetical protein
MLSFWQERLERCPALRPCLKRAVRYAVNGESLPATLTLGDIPQDKTVRCALEEIFPGCREENGRLKARLDDSQRDPARWLPLAGLLGLKPEQPSTARSAEACFQQALQRLKILYPEDTAFISTLTRDDQLQRFFKNVPTASDELISLFEALIMLRTAPAGLTLSELGATFFNDSKCLRSGPLRQQLEHLLRLQAGNPDDDASALFNACGIIENPYTTHVVVFAPFAYRTHDGAWLDWPLLLWQRGEAAILSWKTVRALSALRFEKPCHTLVTSENAAPFHRLVETHQPCLYTEGYPNAAVKTLLSQFAQTGAVCHHWGDTDLDGYRIAEQVARCIPTTFMVPPTDTAPSRLLRLTHEQHRRLQRFIESHPDFPYLDNLRHTLSNGWLEQEQTINLFPCGAPPVPTPNS